MELDHHHIFSFSFFFSHIFRNFIAKFTLMDDSLIELINILSNFIIDDYKQFELLLDNFGKYYSYLIPIRGPPDDQTDQNADSDDKSKELITELEKQSDYFFLKKNIIIFIS
jgi:hypothetical protein